jgi:hypothetical protein
MSFMAILPYHVVPPFGVKKTQTSTAFAVVVRDRDAAPPGKTKLPPAQATVLPAVPSFVKINVNEDEPVAMGSDSVNVQLPVSVAVKTLAFRRSMVVAVPVLPRAETVSA